MKKHSSMTNLLSYFPYSDDDMFVCRQAVTAGHPADFLRRSGPPNTAKVRRATLILCPAARDEPLPPPEPTPPAARRHALPHRCPTAAPPPSRRRPVGAVPPLLRCSCSPAAANLPLLRLCHHCSIAASPQQLAADGGFSVQLKRSGYRASSPHHAS